MKILSNFDTELATSMYQEYVQLFGEEYVVLVRKSKLLRWISLFFPIFGFLLTLLVGLFLLQMFVLPGERVYRCFAAAMLLWMIALFFQLSRKFMDFRMDFMIVTPKEVMKYDQHGVFSRVSEKISADKIKTITVEKKGFLASFFDIGSIIFLAEGESEAGDIVMDMIDKVDATEKKLRHILRQDMM